MRRVIPLLRPETGAVLVVLACAALNQILVLAEPQLLRLIIDRYVMQVGRLATGVFATGAGGLVLLSFTVAFGARLLRGYQSYAGDAVACRVSTRLFMQMVGESLLLPYARFEAIPSGERLQRLEKARADVNRVLSHLSVPLSAAVALAVVVLYGFTIAWPMGLALLLLPALIAAVLLPLGGSILRQQGRIADEMARSSAAATETFRNAELVMSLGVERDEAARLDIHAQHLQQLEMQRLALERRFRFVEGTVHNTARGVVLLIALWLLSRGRLSPGQLVTVFLYSQAAFAPLSRLSEFAATVRESGLSLDAAGGLAASSAASRRAEDVPTIRQLALEDVSFRYPDSPNKALDRVTLRLQAGHVVALVGTSGAGKSSIVKMLIGLYSPEGGSVLLNGSPVSAGTGLRRRIGVVTQETQLFAGTIRDNLRLARPDAADDECFDALRAAGALGIVERGANGLDLRIGEGGVGLSGGERQRIAIARALLRNPDVLIFDEATSMLDARAEQEIMDAIDRLTTGGAGRPTLTISHRASVAARADYVYVLANGRIVEEGRHETLTARSGLYGALWRDSSIRMN
jgi:ATP-binding cassette, subfamily B, bacterial